MREILKISSFDWTQIWKWSFQTQNIPYKFLYKSVQHSNSLILISRPNKGPARVNLNFFGNHWKFVRPIGLKFCKEEQYIHILLLILILTILTE